MTENKMGQMEVKKLLLNISIPLIISMIIQAMYNIVDGLYVARIPGIGESGLTAISIALPIQLLGISVAVGVGIGLNALLSKALGAREYHKLSDIINNGIFINLLFSLVFLVIGLFFIDDFFRISTSDELVRTLGTNYLKIITIFTSVKIYQIQFQRMLQSTGLTKYQMISQGISALINIILDPIFIFTLNMGISGAAIATILSQVVGFVIALSFNLLKNKELKIDLKHFYIKKDILKEIFHIAFPAILTQSLTSIQLFFVNMVLVNISDSFVTSYGIFYKYSSLIAMPMFGLNNGIIPIVSYNFGAKNQSRIKETLKFAKQIIVIFSLIGVGFSLIFSQSIARIFLGESDIIFLTSKTIKVCSLSLLFLGLNTINQGFLQAMHEANKSLIITIFKIFIVLLPSLYLIKLFNSDLIFYSFVIAEFITLFLSFFFKNQVINQKVNQLKN